MYINPLLEILQYRNSNNTTLNGIYSTQPDEPVTLLIDVKEKPTIVWPIVLQQLAPFREKSFLTRYEIVYPAPGFIERQTLWPGPLVVVGTGLLDTASESFLYNTSQYWEYHDTFLDAPLETLPDVNTFQNFTSRMQYDPEISFYASVSFKKTIGSVMSGFSKAQLALLRRQIDTARRSGLVSRYWDTPTWPIAYRDYVWDVLAREGVGILNVDDVKAAAQQSWTTEYKSAVAVMIAASLLVVTLVLVFGVVGLRMLRKNHTRDKDVSVRL